MGTQNILRNISNIPGWRSSKKIVVFESDDWGSIRMPSLNSFKKLKEAGVSVDKGDAARYNTNDTLAGKNDFTALYETLSSVKDRNNNPVVFTALSLVANPDFEKIKQSNFRQYFYEPITTTIERYHPGQSVFELWKEGIQKKLFVPQFHGREHLNVMVWMDALRNNDPQTHAAFNEGCWGFSNKHMYNVKYQAAFDVANPAEINYHGEVIKEGLTLFEQLFGYRASFFVPPNGPFNNSLEQTAFGAGIKYMSASKIQHEAVGLGKTKKVFHYLGQKNKYGQTYLTRNCFFEPSQPGKNWVQECLSEMEIAFRWKKPAIISSHRVNYIGVLNEVNRKAGLAALKQLLDKIVLKWPDAEFMTSNQLGELITGK
ncbi:MAG: hypothetical protein QM791_20900 [Ferruginibacter sp.]